MHRLVVYPRDGSHVRLTCICAYRAINENTVLSPLTVGGLSNTPVGESHTGLVAPFKQEVSLVVVKAYPQHIIDP